VCKQAALRRVEVVTSLSQGRTAAAQCGLLTYKSVPVIFEPPCIFNQPINARLGYKMARICRDKRRIFPRSGAHPKCS